MSPAYVLMRCKFAVTETVGKIRTSTGNMSVTKIAQKKTLRRGNRKYTIAYAESTEITSLPTVTAIAMMKLLVIILLKGKAASPVPCCQTSTMLLQRWGPGSSGSGV